MGQRKVWTEEEDKVLREILQQRNIKKWSIVSKIMEQEYGMAGRSGKQCRQRWYNQLDPKINNRPWSESQEEILFRNHDNFGNKWARIAQDLPGRTDNAIKNHFYSTLRKAVRRLNRFVAETKQKKQMREIKPLILSKIIILSGDKVSGPSGASQQVIEKSVQIKQRLISFAKECEQESLDQTKMRNLVEDIMVFNGSYKRRNYAPKKEVTEQVKVQQMKPPEVHIQPKILIPEPKVFQPPKPERLLPPEPIFQKQEFRSSQIPQKCFKQVRPMKLLSSSVQALLNPTGSGFPLYRKVAESELPFTLETFPPVAGAEMGAGEEYTYSTKNANHLMEGQINLESLPRNQ